MLTVPPFVWRAGALGRALAAAVIEYRDGLHAAAEKTHRFGRLVGLVPVVTLASAVWDALTGSVRDVVSSCVYLGLLAIELFWWPRRRDRLLSNADRAAPSAMQSIDDHEPESLRRRNRPQNRAPRRASGAVAGTLRRRGHRQRGQLRRLGRDDGHPLSYAYVGPWDFAATARTGPFYRRYRGVLLPWAGTSLVRRRC
jgi:hypothetical protein